MARGKNNSNENTTQLKLFDEELSSDVKQEDNLPKEEALPKRVGNKKFKEPVAPTEIPVIEELKEPPPAVTTTVPEETELSQEPVKPRSVARSEDELKAKIKKNQEERLAALRKARGKK